MLTISKKAISACHVLMWGGLALFLLGVILLVMRVPYSVLLAVAGILLAAVGVFWLDRLYRCPHCGKKLLDDKAGRGSLMEKCPPHCPHCLRDVQVEMR